MMNFSGKARCLVCFALLMILVLGGCMSVVITNRNTQSFEAVTEKNVLIDTEKDAEAETDNAAETAASSVTAEDSASQVMFGSANGGIQYIYLAGPFLMRHRSII